MTLSRIRPADKTVAMQGRGVIGQLLQLVLAARSASCCMHGEMQQAGAWCTIEGRGSRMAHRET